MKPNKSILVVDDEAVSIEFITRHFTDQSYDILYARNGARGYEVAVDCLPDLIIMDWAMPVMNGIDATLKLKANDKTKNIPILIATGVMTDSVDLQKALEIGAIDFVRKPFDTVELSARVNAALLLSASMKEIRDQRDEITELRATERQALNERLDFKERELSIKALQTQEQSQLLEEILEDLKHIKKEHNITESRTFSRLVKRIKNGLKERNSEEFLYHFQHVHPDFFKRLKEYTVELSPNELKLCAYVKLGMRNKEIAALTGTEVTSVKTAISRIKKRLKVDTNLSLRKFVSELV